MTKEEFSKFVEKTLDELLLYVEIHTEQKFSGIEYFKWGMKATQVFYGLQNIVDEIVARVYISENEIYPCVDLFTFKVSNKDTIYIWGRIAGYPPTHFQKGYTGRPGPFHYFIDSGIISPNINTKDEKFVQNLIDKGLLYRNPLK